MAAWASTTSKYWKGSLASPITSPQTSISLVVPPPLHRTTTDPNAPPVYIFRVANAQANANSAPLVLCSGGWCLARLRTTCELCSFLRRGVVEKVWAEPPQVSLTPSTSVASYTQGGVLGSVASVLGRDKEATAPKEKEGGDAPPVPPRRRQLTQLSSSIWEKGLGAFGSRSGSRSGTPTQEEPKEEPPKVERRLPPPPASDDSKLSIVPPPPPPRARPVPPVPGATEAKEAHDAEPEHHEEIPHAMVFDAADHEHGHHAMSPTTDKRHSVPPPLPPSLLSHPPTFPDSPITGAESLPVVDENPAGSELSQAAPEPTFEAPAPATESEPAAAPVSEPTPVQESASAPEPTAAPETPSRAPALSRPVRARLLPPDSDKPPTSPGGIALPESPSKSPGPGARPASPSPRPMTPPNRMSSPAPGSPTPARHRAGSIRAESPVPGSPADGGPPKIPRRAPRRAAPVPPPAPSAGPDPFTHTEKAEEKPVEHGEGEKKVDDGETKAHEEDKPKVEEHHVVRPPRRAVPAPPALPARARTPKPAEETHPAEIKSAEDKPVEEVKPIDAVESVEESKTEEPEPASANKPAGTAVDSVSPDVAPEKAHNSAPAPVAATTDDKSAPQPEPVAALANEKSEDTEKKPVDPIDKPAVEDGQFVGEQSWEERAYKEIVKLREDMFWARVGSAW